MLFCYIEANRGGVLTVENEDTLEMANKKRFLKRYRKNLNCIIRLEKKYAILQQKINGLKSSSFSSMPRGGQPVTMDDMITDKIDLENRIKRLKEKGKNLKREILEEIDSLDEPRYIAVLEGFFVDCLSMEDIAENEGYTVRHVYSIYRDAIKTLTVNKQ